MEKIKRDTFWLNYFRPSLFLKSIKDVNPYSLKKNGIKLVICDLDNTLAPHFSRYPNKKAIDFAKSIMDQDIKFVVVSNNTKKRVSRYCEILNPDNYVWNAKKPFKRKIENVMKEFNIGVKETIIIGDQFITDIWAANQIGCKSVLVLPVANTTDSDEDSSWLTKVLDKYIYGKLESKNFLNDENLDSKISEGDYVIL